MHPASEKVQTMGVDPAQIVPLQRDAMAVEELENLDGNLAAVLDPVAKLSGGEDAAFAVSRDIGHDGHYLMHRRAQEEMIVRHFVGPSHAPGELQKPPGIALRR